MIFGGGIKSGGKETESKVTGAKLRLQNDIQDYNSDKIKSV